MPPAPKKRCASAYDKRVRRSTTSRQGIKAELNDGTGNCNSSSIMSKRFSFFSADKYGGGRSNPTAGDCWHSLKTVSCSSLSTLNTAVGHMLHWDGSAK